MGFFIYVLAKIAAYIAWCGLGAKLHGHTDRLFFKSVVYGVLRVLMGIVLGLGLILWLINTFYRGTRNDPLLYLLAYIPVRWLEWSSMAVLMDVGNRSLRNFAIGRSTPSRLWRTGGIAISCLADIPMILAAGLPVGRFMC